MLKTKINKHVPLPKETPAFFCGNCGVVSLYAGNIMQPPGQAEKSRLVRLQRFTKGQALQKQGKQRPLPLHQLRQGSDQLRPALRTRKNADAGKTRQIKNVE